MQRYPDLTLDKINQAVVTAEYAVRGAIPQRATQIARDLKDPEKAKQYPFKRVIFSNIGNPMVMGLKYTKFPRDLISLLASPHVLQSQSDESLIQMYGCTQECVDRARQFLRDNPEGLGAYTHSKGFLSVRREVAHFLEERDGYPADPEEIFLSDGASSSVKTCIQLLAGPQPGNSAFLIPVPQYPLYTAALTMNHAEAVFYYLDEAANWEINVAELENVIKNHMATKKSEIRSITVINPNNPCGQVSSYAGLRAIVDLCDRYNIAIFADEVYQINRYAENQGEERPIFYSMKRVVRDWEKETGRRGPMLFSFHSVSKGYLGECGLRGGYLECCNVPQPILDELYKSYSVCLCSNTVGQVVVSCMVNPPKHDGEFTQHYNEVLDSLERKAQLTTRTLNSVEFMTCQRVSGAMYAFPRIFLPQRFIQQAQERNVEPDADYCMRLLESKGVCVVPGSGFLQRPGTYHFRMSILEAEERYEAFLQLIKEFHEEIWAEYGDSEEKRKLREELYGDECE